MKNPESKIGCAVVIIYGISALVSLAIAVGVVIVAIHFISKWW